MSFGEHVIGMISELQDLNEYRALHWDGNFTQYLELVQTDGDLARNAFQRLYDMILTHGQKDYVNAKKHIVRYNFFDDPFDNGKDAVFGIDIYLVRLVDVFKSAAEGYGTDRRVLLLHGPVGSAKSTIVRLLKKGLEAYARTPAGALYTYEWLNNNGETTPCPMHEEPLHLVPEMYRAQIEQELNSVPDRKGRQVRIQGSLCPVCRFIYKEKMAAYGGDWSKVIQDVRVRRILLSEEDRVGIGTFQPKDEKNQDSTELTGDVNYRKIAEFGSESDPRAFNFDGEFNIANRGIIEFVEMLKLDVAFLYDLLTASQEHMIKPKKFAQTEIDEVIIGHTNEPEFKRLQNNEFMEALRDRTIKIDIPYITRLSDELRIYTRDFTRRNIAKHIAPHTLQMAAMWAILTRLEEPSNANVSIMQKLKLYNGRALPGFTEDHVKELRKEAKREGMEGISPRYIQDKVSNALVRWQGSCINAFTVMRELEGGLKNHSLIGDEETRQRYTDLLAVVKKEYEDIAKNEVQKAISADEEAIARLCANYIDELKAFTRKDRIKDPFTGNYREPDERLMRSIEEKIDVPQGRKDDFRTEIMNYIASLAIEGKTFDYSSNERLRRALELKLFEDQKDSIKFSSMVTNVTDKETQEKIEVVRTRLIRQYGYCEVCAKDVLNYVASIFARGDAKE